MNFIDWLREVTWDDMNIFKDKKAKLTDMEYENEKLKREKDEFYREVQECQANGFMLSSANTKLNQEVDYLTKELMKYQPDEKETYYNTKYPATTITYNGRPKPKSLETLPVDVRTFLNDKDCIVSGVVGKNKLSVGTESENVLACLKWVIQNIHYTADQTAIGYVEYWQIPYETLVLRSGDCEDGAILLANMLLASGVKPWKVRLAAGWVDSGVDQEGHCYLTYYVEDTDKWVVLDWCYWANTLPISDRLDYKEEGKYKDVWFSWTKDFAWASGLNTYAKELLEK